MRCHARIRNLTLIGIFILLLCPEFAMGAVGFPDRLHIVAMLRSGEFGSLDAMLSGYQERYESGRGSEAHVVSAFLAFANSEPALRSRLDEWVLEMPDSYAASLARGAYLWRLGWLSRGGRSAGKTRRQQFAAMRQYFTAASADLYRAIERNGRLTVAYGFLISIGMTSASDDRIRSILKKGLENNPDSFHLRVRYLYTLVPWWGGSLPKLRAAVQEMKPDFATYPALRVLEGYPIFIEARVFKRSGKRDIATAYFNRAVEFGDFWRYPHERGQNFYYLKNYDAALKDLNRALQLNPQVPDILQSRAKVYSRLGKFTEALADYSLILRIDAYDGHALVQRAWVYRKLKRFNEEIEDLEKAVKFESHDRHIWARKGHLYAKLLKNYDQARNDMWRAIKLEPANLRYWYTLGVAIIYGAYCEFSDNEQVCAKPG